MSHAALVQRLFAAFAQRDLAAIRAALAPDVRWHTPGDNLLAGTRVGVDEVVAHLGRPAELTDGSYAIEVLDVLEGATHVAAVYRGTGRRAGGTLDVVHNALYAIADGTIREVWVTPLDQAAFDTFWS